jgi:transcriptional regulator with XRE-family HTH domain
MNLGRLVVDNIKKIRKEKGISQEKLAEKCNINTSYIGLMEIYRNIPKLSTIEKIAEALDVDPLELFGLEIQYPAGKQKNLFKKRILSAVDREIDKILGQ